MSRRRAYLPRRSTLDLKRAIEARGVRVIIIAPHHGITTRPACLRLFSGGNSGEGRPIYSDFSMADARAWLAAEAAAD